jgi:hypothetical protein
VKRIKNLHHLFPAQKFFSSLESRKYGFISKTSFKISQTRTGLSSAPSRHHQPSTQTVSVALETFAAERIIIS